MGNGGRREALGFPIMTEGPGSFFIYDVIDGGGGGTLVAGGSRIERMVSRKT